MSFLTDVYALLFYVATLIFVLGLAFRIRLYARTPAPLKIPTMPAPLTQAGVTMRMAREVVLFESLFKSNKWTWIFGWLFHFSLVLAFLRHLRYAMSPDNIFWPLVNLEVVQSFGRYAGYGIKVLDAMPDTAYWSACWVCSAGGFLWSVCAISPHPPIT